MTRATLLAGIDEVLAGIDSAALEESNLRLRVAVERLMESAAPGFAYSDGVRQAFWIIDTFEGEEAAAEFVEDRPDIWHTDFGDDRGHGCEVCAEQELDDTRERLFLVAYGHEVEVSSWWNLDTIFGGRYQGYPVWDKATETGWTFVDDLLMLTLESQWAVAKVAEPVIKFMTAPYVEREYDK
jgi:hypothetical protein